LFRFQKRSFRFRKKTNVFKNDPLVLNFYKTNSDRFWKPSFLLKRFATVFYTIVFKKTIVFEKNDRFWKNILLTIMLTIVNEGSSLTIVNEESSLTIVNERFSLTIVNEGLSLTKRRTLSKWSFWKKNYMQLYWMPSYMKFNSCGEVKTPWYFLKNYSIISTDALQVGFLSSLMIVNKGVVVNNL